jgi:hypothetical protein
MHVKSCSHLENSWQVALEILRDQFIKGFVLALIATHVRTIEVAAIEERMTALEEKQQHK